jgi:uncharacterized RDD family membrane protein YckC
LDVNISILILPTSGQSIGKRFLKIKTVDLSGNRIDIKSAEIESFGKAFLLPIDVILGWISTNNNKRQRVFSRISNIIVIKLKNPQLAPNDIHKDQTMKIQFL